MKIWILNNTKIDKKSNWENYFENDFIQKLEKYSKEGDIVIHLGHIFNNSEIISVKNINKMLDIFEKISSLRTMYFLDGYDTELLKLIKLNNTIIVNEPLLIDNVKIIPKKYNIIEHIEGDIVLINSQIEQSILENYQQDFYCGLYDMKTEYKNITNVGTPYQLGEISSDGFYVIDATTKKKKYFQNNTDIKYKTIRITDIKQIDDLDKDFINDNNISIEIDKSLVEYKKIKIDVLLNNFNFKKISYINDEEDEIEIIDNTSLKMEDLLIEKIKNSENKNLLSEFENILKIYKEKY